MKLQHFVLVFAVFAVFLAFAIAHAGEQSSPEAPGVCAFSSTSFEATVLGLKRGEPESEVASIVGLAALPTNCKHAVSEWVNHPDTPVRARIKGLKGGAPELITGRELKQLRVSSTINAAKIQRGLDCLRAYGSGTADELSCVNGALKP